ncbi:MAG: glycosyltransferase [Nitrososphaerales archaeon]
MHRIYSAIFGSGLGHVTRVHEIAKRLPDCSFEYSSFDEAYDYLLKYNEKVFYAPSVAVRWNLAGGVSGSGTLIGAPRSFATFLDQVNFERKKISRFNPRVVLSDSRLSAVIAGKSLFYPVITILNQIRILFPPRFRKGVFSSFLERLEADILGLYWSLSNEILVPDLPPPFTISEANVSRVSVSNRIHYTGFMTPKLDIPDERLAKVRSSLALDSRPIVFVQISGPNKTKDSFLGPALESSSYLARKYNVIISKGFPSGSTTPIKLANGAWVYDWCPVKDELFQLSKVLVARSGHNTLSQCINAAKPSVVVPIFNHSEQIWNAKKFAKLGLGIEIRSESLTAKKLEISVETCLEDSSYQNNMEKLKQISSKFEGIEAAANIVRGFL